MVFWALSLVALRVGVGEAADGVTTVQCQNRSIQINTDISRPCLCAFDVDRTLTGYQELLSECPRNEVKDGVKDFAYLYATPRGFGFLTLSELAQGLNSTFCRRCYLGVASAGGAGLDDEKQVLLCVLHAAVDPSLSSALPNWTTEEDPSQQIESEAPFVVWCGEGGKHRCVSKIVEWYSSGRNVTILDEDVYFFDDKEDNIRPFVGTDYNALQVSCESRNGSRGLCGGLPSEVTPVRGVVLCADGAQVCLEDIDHSLVETSKAGHIALAAVALLLMLH